MKNHLTISVEAETIEKAKEAGINISATMETLLEKYLRSINREVREIFKKELGRDMTEQEKEAFDILEKEDGRTINEFAEFIKFRESGAKEPPIKIPKYIEALRETETFKECLAFWNSELGKNALMKSRESERKKRILEEKNSSKALYITNQELYNKAINNGNTNTKDNNSQAA
jgi:hypothetical protein